MRKKIIIASSIIIAIAILITALWLYDSLYGKDFKNTETVYLYLDKDDNIDSVKYKLTKLTQTTNQTGFDIIAKHYKLAENIPTGRYAVKTEDSMTDIVRRIRAKAQTPVKIVIPSVRTIEDLASRINGKLLIDSAAIAGAFSDTTICRKLGYTQETVIALFLPDTYEMWWDCSIETFIRRIKSEHDTFWNEERIKKAQNARLSKTEVITLASIVDEETANNSEKPDIAGLYINRLNKGMPLQSDPTVKFAMKDFKLRRILYKHLETDSPYNTYKNTGLPPGPIRIPSKAGIDSVLNYRKHSYLYMCAKEDFSGTHNFATTYTQHLANARRYTNALNKRGIK